MCNFPHQLPNDCNMTVHTCKLCQSLIDIFSSRKEQKQMQLVNILKKSMIKHKNGRFITKKGRYQGGKQFVLWSQISTKKKRIYWLIYTIGVRTEGNSDLFTVSTQWQLQNFCLLFGCQLLHDNSPYHWFIYQLFT